MRSENCNVLIIGWTSSAKMHELQDGNKVKPFDLASAFESVSEASLIDAYGDKREQAAGVELYKSGRELMMDAILSRKKYNRFVGNLIKQEF